MNAHRLHQDHLSDDELVDLVNGFADEPSRASAVAHASACTECDARLREFAAVHELGRARAPALLQTGAAREPDARERAGVARRSWSSRVVRRPALLAAAAAVVAVVGVYLTPRMAPHSPADRARPEWLPHGAQLLEGRRGEGSADDSTIAAGIAAYEQRDLVGVERILTPPIQAIGADWVRRLYLANTYVATGRNATAVSLLSDFHGDYLPEPWRGELQWTLMVALARSHHPAAADSVLRLLRARGDTIGDRARRLSDAQH